MIRRNSEETGSDWYRPCPSEKHGRVRLRLVLRYRSVCDVKAEIVNGDSKAKGLSVIGVPMC